MYKSEARGGKTAHLTITVFLGGILSLGVALLILLAGAAAVSGGVLKGTAAPGVTVIACVIGCLLGGLFSCGRCGERRLPVGAGTGAVCFLLVLGVGFIMGDGPEIGSQALVELASCICGGAAAAIFGKKRKKSRRTARRAK